MLQETENCLVAVNKPLMGERQPRKKKVWKNDPKWNPTPAPMRKLKRRGNDHHNSALFNLAFGRKEESELFDFFRDKSVILIGPSDYLLGQNRGAEFDKYDIIIRMNLGCPVPPELKADIGSRTDVLYHIIMSDKQIAQRPDLFKFHTSQQVKDWQKDGVKWFVSKRGVNSKRVKKFALVVKDSIPWTNVPNYTMRQLERTVGTNPNMATVVAGHLEKSNLKSFKIVGCDFHQTGYFAGYGGMTEEQAAQGAGSTTCWGQVPQPQHQVRMHIKSVQIEWFKQLAIRDSRYDVSELMERTDNLCLQ